MEVTPEQAAAAKIFQSLKDNKEAFYSNLKGGSIAEINFVTAVAPIAYFIYAALQTRKGFFQSDEYSLPLFLIDFGLNAAALLLSITVYSQYALYFSLFLALNGCVIYFAQSPLTQSKQRKPPPKDDVAKELSEKEKLDVYLPKKAFITAWRGSMMMVTCLAILAVDFPVFPRRFAKVETWGQSLMDLGVGSFVFANGVATARGILRDAHLGKTAPLLVRLKRSLRSSLALLALGLVRLLLTKTADYHEHITEYGLHWNFFMTLGCLPPFVALFQGIFTKMAFPELLAICTGAGYQLVLFNYGLQNWVLLAERTNIINANKEGIASFFGYLAIFLAGQATGMRILPLQQQSQSQAKQSQSQSKQSQASSKKKSSTQSVAKRPLIKPLLLQAIVWTMLYQLTDNYKYGMINTQISRRIANMPYLCWVAAFNCWQLLAFYLIEAVCWGDSESAGGKNGSVASYEERSPRLLRAFNRNGLIIFLVANIATGLVNMTMNTIETKTPVSMGVLFAYAVGLSSLAVGLDLKNITIKL
ncbi:Glucosaminyl phosphatidylinositol (GlcN-PI) nositol acylation protein [Orbilia oligospora]|uniref:GPI-anchored wall transfer protein n=1 Tax=Orbilia oligospora TaxID=2813651 RepID=A0A7C8J0S0_ORBOL|nr:Glucosaminyl phosphatidylinositol (GlcN-PI) nositol acylation protein [Orbilia oligospora]KAF3080827.1 Glucosaminyl phosphatidylinositol (GlcN-PI) nositol acylation protein [Orbilia oligospora]KAF3090245.1 Glucosaminyl phosphatidylinositol (GlcN-PI) nositol acylation protein [Orbilia oligospora]KAF3140856.1 Glucosaminyl phosphatidylinositol (GlcN-PI) nositol acylation protein [Orbilia oligospora]